MKLPIYLCCDRIKYLLACSVNDLKGGCLGKPVQSLVYLGRSTVPPTPKIGKSDLPSNRLYDLPPPKSPSPIYPQIAKSDLPSNRLYDLPPPKSPSPIYPQIVCTIYPPEIAKHVSIKNEP